MKDEYQFNSFEEMLDKFEEEGYSVERVSEDSAVVFNDGVEPDYSIFDNFVATVAVENEFGFRTPNNMKELHNKTTIDGQDSSKFEIYLGVFAGNDPTVLDESDYEFNQN